MIITCQLGDVVAARHRVQRERADACRRRTLAPRLIWKAPLSSPVVSYDVLTCASKPRLATISALAREIRRILDRLVLPTEVPAARPAARRPCASGSLTTASTLRDRRSHVRTPGACVQRAADQERCVPLDRGQPGRGRRSRAVAFWRLRTRCDVRQLAVRVVSERLRRKGRRMAIA